MANLKGINGKNGASVVDECSKSVHFEAQILRVLMCTARLLASSPGGLRFKPGTRPWLAPLSTAFLSY